MNKIFLLFFWFLCVFFLPLTSDAAFFENNTDFLFLEKFFFKKQKYLVFLIFFLPSIYFINKKNYLSFCFFLFFQIFTILYWSSLILWIRDLAGDSLSEINTLNIYFIFSWLNSIFNFLKPNLEFDSFFKFYLFGFMIYFLIKFFVKNQKNYLINLPIILSFLFIISFINFNISHLIGNITTQKDIKKNFINSQIEHTTKNKINLIVFIGESNSLLNSDFFIQKLLNKKEIIQKGKFDYYQNIYSTHTHSTPALLRLFSVPVSNQREDLLKPIVNQKRINVFSFLDRNIKKNYVSSTETEGFNNIHYSIFFKDFENKIFLDETSYKFEKEFFSNQINEIFNLNDNNNLIILHSIVGHAPYHKFIPDNISFKNELYKNKNLVKITGDKNNYLSELINYDKALKYNFDNLENIISKIDDNIPTVLIYLSDHGESVFTANGHDSSRLVHEMLRIPFIIFYNNQFVKKHGDIIDLHKKFKNRINTTDIFKEILFNIYSFQDLKNKYIVEDNIKFQKIIFQRNKNEFVELLDLNFDKVDLPKNFLLKEELDTSVHVLARNLNENQICYHSSNTIARIKRGLQITSCLEFDLVIDNEKLFIYHPPSKNINFTFEEFLKHSADAKSLWIDAKNINIKNNCDILYKAIVKSNLELTNILIEFPTNTQLKDESLLACIANMKSININISYYISNDDIAGCYAKIVDDNPYCKKLTDKIFLINKNKIFNNISFDYKFFKILEKFKYNTTNLKFNTWHINFEEVKNINLSKFNLIIPFNANHNKNIF